MPKKQAAAAPAEPAPSGSHAESPEEAMKEFGLCLQRSLDLCQSVSKEIEKNVLDVDTVVSSDAKFKQRLARFLSSIPRHDESLTYSACSHCHDGSLTHRTLCTHRSTCGVMLNGCTVDNVVIGGPAYGKMTRGDTIKSVDGQKATSSNIAALLFGSDLPGSEVKVEVQGSKGIKKVVLRRMKVQAITDKVHMFHLFTEVKKAASVHKDTNMDKLVDQSIDHWTKMQIAEAEHDHRVCENVEAMQHLAQSTLAALTKELASMRGYSEVLFGCIKDRSAQDKAQAENADLHNQVEALWSENDALKKQLAALQQEAIDYQARIKALEKQLQDTQAAQRTADAYNARARRRMYTHTHVRARARTHTHTHTRTGGQARGGGRDHQVQLDR